MKNHKNEKERDSLEWKDVTSAREWMNEDVGEEVVPISSFTDNIVEEARDIMSFLKRQETLG